MLGRAEEVHKLAELLERARLVTLTGAPGIGKTRLALELAEGYGGGARVVELAPVMEAGLVPGAVAAALSVPEVAGQSITETLAMRLRGRRLLLVLDNCEHLVEACAELVDALLSGRTELRILATSREPLGVPGERVWQVPPLSFPGGDEEAVPEVLAGYAAVGLFVERAASVETGFSLNAYVAAPVAEICRRLDGIPLAIELAAARVESLTPEEIARRLDDRFSLLRNGSGSLLTGHETLQAALDWSHELLSAPERALLRRLSVFLGGFELEAADAVCAGGDVKPGRVSDLVAGLVAKSLVVADTANTRGRYRLLETIRAYAGDRLEDAGEAASFRAAHARFYLELAERAEPELTGRSQASWFEYLQAERENLRLAIEWCLGHGQTEWALRLAGALVLYWRVRCHFSEGRELLGAAVAAGDGQALHLRAKALWGKGFMALMAGDDESAIPTLEDSLSCARQVGDVQGCARALLVLGNSRQYRADPQALSLLEESAALARQVDDFWCLGHALALAGFEHVSFNDPAAARPLFEECLAVARRAGEKQSLRFGLLGLGSVALHQGDYRSAESLLDEGRAVARELREDYIEATALLNLGQLALARGDSGRARQLHAEATDRMPHVHPAGVARDLLLLLARVNQAEGKRRAARLLFQEVLDGMGRNQTSIPALLGLGELAAEEGDPGEGRRLFEQARDLARGIGDKGSLARALHALGQLARAAGHPQRAAALHAEALQLQRQTGAAPGTVSSLEAMAGLAASMGRREHAARLLGAAEAARAECYPRSESASLQYEKDLAVIRQGLSVEEFEAAWREGAALSLDEAAAQASKGQTRRGRSANGWASLTDTEQQLAELVAERLTNPEIAERLFISLSTVKTHLSHIYSKLGMTSRKQLAAEVRRRGEQPSANGSRPPRGRAGRPEK